MAYLPILMHAVQFCIMLYFSYIMTVLLQISIPTSRRHIYCCWASPGSITLNHERTKISLGYKLSSTPELCLHICLPFHTSGTSLWFKLISPDFSFWFLSSPSICLSYCHGRREPVETPWVMYVWTMTENFTRQKMSWNATT